MIWLWIAAALISAALAALIMQRGVRAAKAQRGDNPALAVYRRQMAELDELAERGVLAEGERRAVRAETGRRLLAAAGRSEASGRRSGPVVILIAAGAAPLVAAIAYVALGAPGYADQPFQARLLDWEHQAEQNQPLSAPQMAAVWRALAAQHPTDTIPLVELARAEFESQQPTEAIQALHKAIALAPARTDLWELLGQALTAQNGGEVDAEAQDAFRHLLALDPANVNARYYLARAKIASGDVAGGLAGWRALQASLAAGDQRGPALAQEIAAVATTGRLPPEGGQDQSVGTPQIQAMVDGLAARLKANPDDPAGWVRLVRAYAVLGEADRRDAALAAARSRYAGRPDILAQLAAAKAGPGQPGAGQPAPQPNAAMSPTPGSP